MVGGSAGVLVWLPKLFAVGGNLGQMPFGSEQLEREQSGIDRTGALPVGGQNLRIVQRPRSSMRSVEQEAEVAFPGSDHHGIAINEVHGTGGVDHGVPSMGFTVGYHPRIVVVR